MAFEDRVMAGCISAAILQDGRLRRPLRMRVFPPQEHPHGEEALQAPSRTMKPVWRGPGKIICDCPATKGRDGGALAEEATHYPRPRAFTAIDSNVRWAIAAASVGCLRMSSAATAS